jgi:hypothetical protein
LIPRRPRRMSYRVQVRYTCEDLEVLRRRLRDVRLLQSAWRSSRNEALREIRGGSDEGARITAPRDRAGRLVAY